MSNADVDNGISPELMISAREAGVKCLHAYRELVEAAMKPAEAPVQDYRPLLRSLFATLINGWHPISQCWPKLRLDDATTTYHDQADIDWRTATPSDIWLLARNVFWKIAWFTPFRGPASMDWRTWTELDPSLEEWWGEWEPFVPEDDPSTGEFIRETIAKCPQPDSWDEAAIAISKAPAGSNQDLLDLPDVVRRGRNPTPYVVPEKRLPCNTEELEKLRHEANELLDYYSVQRLECTSLIADLESELTQMIYPGTVIRTRLHLKNWFRGTGDDGGRLARNRTFPWEPNPPPVREVTDYMAPIHLAACRFRSSVVLRNLRFLVLTHQHREADKSLKWWYQVLMTLIGPKRFINREEVGQFAVVYGWLKSANDFAFMHFKRLREEIESQMKALQETSEAGRAGSVENNFLRMSAPERIRYLKDLDAESARLDAELKTREAEQEAETKTLADRLEKLQTDNGVQETLSKELADTTVRFQEAVVRNAQLVADILVQQPDTPSSEQTDDLVTMEQMAMLLGLNKDILRNRLNGSEEDDGTAEVPEVHLEAVAPERNIAGVPPITLEQATDDSERKAEKEGLVAKVEKLRSKEARPVWIEAYVSYSLALASGRLRPKHTQEEAYELIKEEEMYRALGARSEKERFGLTFGEIPTCENWTDYNRRARTLLGERKNNPRAGREARVEADDVDRAGLGQGRKLKSAVLRDIHHQERVNDLRSLLTDALIAEGEAETEEKIWDDIAQAFEKLDVTEPAVKQMCEQRDVMRLGEFINENFPPADAARP